ncbi:12393_t:CDS:2, partial [Racocetra fulgida]
YEDRTSHLQEKQTGIDTSTNLKGVQTQNYEVRPDNKDLLVEYVLEHKWQKKAFDEGIII